jgi:hypothetical protein
MIFGHAIKHMILVIYYFIIFLILYSFNIYFIIYKLILLIEINTH